MKLPSFLPAAIAVVVSLSAASAEARGIHRPRTSHYRPARPAILIEPMHRHRAPIRYYFYDYRPFSDRDTMAYGEG